MCGMYYEELLLKFKGFGLLRVKENLIFFVKIEYECSFYRVFNICNIL